MIQTSGVVGRARRLRRDSRPCPGGRQSIGDDGKGEDELQGFVEQGLCAKPCVPTCCFRALRVDRERHAANFRRHRQHPFTGCHEQVAAESLALGRSIDGKPAQPKDRHVITAEPLRQIGRDAGELDRARTDRVVPENTGGFR